MNLKSIIFSVGALVMGTTASAEEKGIIGEVYENNLPVIYNFVDEMPAQKLKDKYHWLTIISWKYDGSKNNGMPITIDNNNMIELEDVIESLIEKKHLCIHAYSRTGNNLKEFAYYIRSQKEFMEAFNKALSNRPRYPIEINFYEDREWSDFQKLLHDFGKNG
jgi:hypothetical protein